MTPRDELERLIADCDKIELITIQALILTTIKNPPPCDQPTASRGELKKAIKTLRIAQHHENCTSKHYEAFEAAIQYIRREWLQR